MASSKCFVLHAGIYVQCEECLSRLSHMYWSPHPDLTDLATAFMQVKNHSEYKEYDGRVGNVSLVS